MHEVGTPHGSNLIQCAAHLASLLWGKNFWVGIPHCLVSGGKAARLGGFASYLRLVYPQRVLVSNNASKICTKYTLKGERTATMRSPNSLPLTGWSLSVDFRGAKQHTGRGFIVVNFSHAV